MIGIYYFKQGEKLRKELEYLIDNNIIKGGEYQLPDALRRLTEAGYVFKPGEVTEWLDCGNKEVTVHTNQRVLEFDWEAQKQLVHESVEIENSVIIPPCFVGKNVKISNSVIGPHVSLGEGTEVINCNISNSIVQQDTSLKNVVMADSMIGSKVVYKGQTLDLSLGDFTTIS
jgi:glucose-1-phosphate thymidylyltransferase